MNTMAGEKELRALPGWLLLFALVAVLVAAVLGFIWSAVGGYGFGTAGFALVIAVDGLCFAGLTVVFDHAPHDEFESEGKEWTR
jgi:hypothetical protein